MKEKARGDEKLLKTLVLGVEKTEPLQSLVGYHFEEKREFLKVISLYLHFLFKYKCNILLR